MMQIKKLQENQMKLKIKDKIILDKKHQNIIAAFTQKIEKLETDNKEMANIEKQHQYMNVLCLNYHHAPDRFQQLFLFYFYSKYYFYNLNEGLLIINFDIKLFILLRFIYKYFSFSI